ncbi:MAG: hypothetical protein QOK43_2905 [Acidimicrobiaceae bacterium]|nr:hypothetical protein [Acidimicrobiaceae bacterium]
MSPQSSMDANQLVKLCTSRVAQSAFLALVHKHQDDLAAATGGQPYVIEVQVKGLRRVRLAVLATGHVVCPFGGRRDPTDACIVGIAEDVTDFLLGKAPLIEAQLAGVLVIPSPDTPTDPLARLRLVISGHLREVFEGVWSATAGWRWRPARRGLWCQEPTALAQRVALTAAGLVAVVSMSVTPHLHAGHDGRVIAGPRLDAYDLSRVAARVAEPGPGGATASRAVGSLEPRRQLSHPPPTGHTAKLLAGDIHRDTSLHAAVVNETPGPRGESRTATSVDLSCRPPIRSVVCLVIDQTSPERASPGEGGG